MEDKIQVSEDNNLDGLYWSFLIQREDVSKSGNATKFVNKCPFVVEIKHHVEALVTDTLNIAIDEHTIRNFARLKRVARTIYDKAYKDNRVPVIKHLDIIGDSEGLRIIIYLGKGYCIDYQWTAYNDHRDTAIEWYKRSGLMWIRNSIKTMIETVDAQQ